MSMRDAELSVPSWSMEKGKKAIKIQFSFIFPFPRIIIRPLVIHSELGNATRDSKANISRTNMSEHEEAVRSD